MMNPQQAWQAALGQLQMEMSKPAFETWVKDSTFLSYDNGQFQIGVMNGFTRDWLDARLKDTVTRLLTGITGAPQQVNFVVRQFENEALEEPETPALEETSIDRAQPVRPNSTLNARYTFDTFVVGNSNRLAHAASQAVAETPAHAYNPLFIYGGVGLGKTHLMHAIGNTAHQNGLQVLYVSSEAFTNDLINSIRTHNTNSFREHYRNIDVLLIDDIQFIAGKESTQEEFFHTFNSLYTQDKQIVLSSDRPPKAMVTLEERLRSRFEWGLIVDIQPPDLETRMAILRSKAERSGRQVSNDILETIARQAQSNIRELEGALTRVLAFSDLSGLPLTPSLVNSALLDLLPQRSAVEPEEVVDAVASAFGVTSEQLTGRARSRDIALPRQVAMYLLREEANVSLPQIGEALGGRDHTTVMYACDKVADLIESDDRLRRQVLKLREQVFGRSPLAI